MLKVDNRKTDRQTNNQTNKQTGQKQYAPDHSIQGHKKKGIWLSRFRHPPLQTEQKLKQSKNTKTSSKRSITQRLGTDLGQSVGVITVNQLVWLLGLRVKSAHPRNSYAVKRSHIVIILTETMV